MSDDIDTQIAKTVRNVKRMLADLSTRNVKVKPGTCYHCGYLAPLRIVLGSFTCNNCGRANLILSPRHREEFVDHGIQDEPNHITQQRQKNPVLDAIKDRR